MSSGTPGVIRSRSGIVYICVCYVCVSPRISSFGSGLVYMYVCACWVGVFPRTSRIGSGLGCWNRFGARLVGTVWGKGKNISLDKYFEWGVSGVKA